MAFSIANKYDSSFSGVGFWLQDDGLYSAPGADLEDDEVLLRIPGSNRTILQSFGVLPRKRVCPIAIDGADLSALVAKHRTSGSLILPMGTVSARLSKITQPQRDNLESTTWKMNLEFTLL